MTEQESEWAAEVIAQVKRDHETILALRDQLDKARTELVKVRDELKRYTDVYADPDGAPLPMSSCETPDERPLTGIAAAAQLRIDAMLRGEEPPSWRDALKQPNDEEI